MIKIRIEEYKGNYVLYEISKFKSKKPEKVEIYRAKEFFTVFNFMKSKYNDLPTEV